MLDKKVALLICSVINNPNKSFIFYSRDTKISYTYVIRLLFEFDSYNWIKIHSKNGRENFVIPTKKLIKIGELIYKLEETLRK